MDSATQSGSTSLASRSSKSDQPFAGQLQTLIASLWAEPSVGSQEPGRIREFCEWIIPLCKNLSNRCRTLLSLLTVVNERATYFALSGLVWVRPLYPENRSKVGWANIDYF